MILIYHIAVQVNLNGESYVVDPTFKAGRKGPISIDQWIGYLGSPHTTPWNPSENPSGDPLPQGGTTRFPAGWNIPNYEYNDPEDYYNKYLEGL